MNQLYSVQYTKLHEQKQYAGCIRIIKKNFDE